MKKNKDNNSTTNFEGIEHQMSALGVTKKMVAERLGVDPSNVTFFFQKKRAFSEPTSERYIKAAQDLIEEMEARHARIKRALPQRKPVLKIQEILPRIKAAKSDLERYFIPQIEVCKATSINPSRISKFLNGQAYINPIRNERVLSACESLIAQKKQRRAN